MEREAEKEKQTECWGTNPAIRAQAGPISSLIHPAAYSDWLVHKMTRPVDPVNSSSPDYRCSVTGGTRVLH